MHVAVLANDAVKVILCRCYPFQVVDVIVVSDPIKGILDSEYRCGSRMYDSGLAALPRSASSQVCVLTAGPVRRRRWLVRTVRIRLSDAKLLCDVVPVTVDVVTWNITVKAFDASVIAHLIDAFISGDWLPLKRFRREIEKLFEC